MSATNRTPFSWFPRFITICESNPFFKNFGIIKRKSEKKNIEVIRFYYRINVNYLWKETSDSSELPWYFLSQFDTTQNEGILFLLIN